MCRNIKTLHNFRPPATDQEIRASALQFVRKLSGSSRPSKANERAFNRAVDQVAAGGPRAARFARDQRPAPRSRARGGQGPRSGGGPLRRAPGLADSP